MLLSTEVPSNYTNESCTAGHDSYALQVICTFTAALNLPAAEERVVDEVRQAAVEVEGGQAALEALPRNDQLREVLVHVGSETSDKQVAWGEERRR